MKANLKIALPPYKVISALCFIVILSLIRGITDIQQIGIAMDTNIALLTLVFCADTYESEYRDKRWEIFSLLPRRNQRQAIRCRLFIQFAFLLFISAVGYWLFYWQAPTNSTGSSAFLRYGLYLGAQLCSILFWGTLSMILVNAFSHLWAGIGTALILWIAVNSVAGEALLGNWSVFSYSQTYDACLTFDWLCGKLTAAAAAILLLSGSLFLYRSKKSAARHLPGLPKQEKRS